MFDNEDNQHQWLRDAIDQMVIDGFIDIVGVNDNGEIIYQVTKKGTDLLKAMERQVARIELLQKNYFSPN